MKRILNFILAIFILFPIVAEAREKMQIAVMDFNVREVTKTLGQIISDLVRAEMVKTGYFVIVERGQMDAILKEQGFQKTGCTDSACAVQLGKLLSAQKILIGEVSKLGSSIMITVRIVDVERGVAEFAETEKAENEDNIDNTCRLLTKKLTKNIITGNTTDLTIDADKKNTFEKKYQIYESARKSQGYGCCWALVIPGGQHFYAGNYGSGALYLIGAITSYALVTSYLNKSNDYNLSESEREKNENYAGTSATLLVLLRVVEVIHGYYAVENYNEQLRKDLDVISSENEVKINFDIAYNPKTFDNQYRLGMTLNF